jgi:hypothetical protein
MRELPAAVMARTRIAGALRRRASAHMVKPVDRELLTSVVAH